MLLVVHFALQQDEAAACAAVAPADVPAPVPAMLVYLSYPWGVVAFSLPGLSRSCRTERRRYADDHAMQVHNEGSGAMLITQITERVSQRRFCGLYLVHVSALMLASCTLH